MRLKILSVLGGVLLFTTCYGQTEEPDKLKPPVPGLPKASLQSVGVQPDSLAKIIQLIRKTPPNDFRGLVVIKDNKLVVEEYFNTYWRETVHDIRSAGKSVTALLVGIAIDKGLVKSPEQSIYDFFPTTKFKLPPKERRADIRIKHLLMMSSGLDADDDRDNSPGATANWLMHEDWASYALGLPMSFKPGEKFIYSDVCPLLIGAIIEETSGKSLLDFAKENLFKPLGIREFYWYTGVGGRTGPMGNLYITTLDFAKIGLLVLNKGRWDGQQVVNASWIDQVSIKRFDPSNRFATGYGYFWWQGKKEANGKSYEYIYASGNGGNVLFVVPTENLVVSITSGAYGQGYGHTRSNNVFQFVLNALR